MQTQRTTTSDADFAAASHSTTAAETLLADLDDAFQRLFGGLRELEELLQAPEPQVVQLTILRLKLSHLRLSRGSLVTAIREFLDGKISDEESIILDELKAAHQRLLQKAVTHTTRWTLDAVQGNWSEYRQATKVLAHQWLIKAREEQSLLLPLINKYAEPK
jgi:hypothetical protein